MQWDGIRCHWRVYRFLPKRKARTTQTAKKFELRVWKFVKNTIACYTFFALRVLGFEFYFYVIRF